MLQYHFKDKDNNAILEFLTSGTTSTAETVFATVYQDAQGEFHLLGSMEDPPANVTLYPLSKERHFQFQETFNPTATPDAEYAEAINSSINEAHIKIINAAKAILGKQTQGLTESEKADVAIARDKLKAIKTPSVEENSLNEYSKKLPHTMLKTVANLPIPAPHKLSENKVSAIQAAQDAIWMAQSSVTADFLKYAGTKATTALGTSTQIAGVAFGVATGALMGIGCGILSAKIYENRAVKLFTEKNKRPPNTNELKLIQRDAKHVGHSVFYGMTFWSLFAGLMECSLQIAKTAANFHPAGLLVNVLISLAAGVGQSVGSCTQHFAHEREKCTDNNGQFDSKKWDQHKTSGEFIKSMVKVAVTSFFAGFAWSMISNFVPKPLKHVLQTAAAKVGKIFIKMAYRTVAAGLAAFGIAFIASKVTSASESSAKIPILNFLPSEKKTKSEEKAKTENARKSHP